MHIRLLVLVASGLDCLFIEYAERKRLMPVVPSYQHFYRVEINMNMCRECLDILRDASSMTLLNVLIIGQ